MNRNFDRFLPWKRMKRRTLYRHSYTSTRLWRWSIGWVLRRRTRCGTSPEHPESRSILPRPPGIPNRTSSTLPHDWLRRSRFFAYEMQCDTAEHLDLRASTMATDLGPHYCLLDELDARQDELLSQLDQLNQRIELLLGQFGRGPDPSRLVPAHGPVVNAAGQVCPAMPATRGGAS